jgi:hypothetical protein
MVLSGSSKRLKKYVCESYTTADRSYRESGEVEEAVLDVCIDLCFIQKK